MSRPEPCAAYVAFNSLEAHFLCGLLTSCGIQATVIEGLSPESDSAPTIWIDRADMDRAKPIFADFEQRVAERHGAARRPKQSAADETLTVTCEECGTQSVFPATRYGLVQHCPQCNAYVDVGEVGFDDWNVEPDGN